MKKVFYFIASISILTNCGTKQIVVEDCIESSQWSSFLNTADLRYEKYVSTVSGSPVITSLKLNSKVIDLSEPEIKTINNGTFSAYKNVIDVNSEDLITYDIDIKDVLRSEKAGSGSNIFYNNFNYIFSMVMFPENYQINFNNEFGYSFITFKSLNLELNDFYWLDGFFDSPQPLNVNNDNVRLTLKQNQTYYNCLNLPSRYQSSPVLSVNSNEIKNVSPIIPNGIYYIGFTLSKYSISNQTFNPNVDYSRLNNDDLLKTSFIKINFINKQKSNNICLEKINRNYSYVLR